ncbi:TetR/AcrR family transcriptional regulator [Kutzneria sp. CA-103260]|uniref:TetR/AcrR family transcriptional regulator n=1 Tax=Kutzneria sp. CA-103260 TaxID=2802641 RepID=UPI001BA5DACE|nr:TetR/AcrR family transcriptional regulator [Kutzneria sp. CA-103260]QUQ64385.1 TetR family transcriptional regulator [Kutzneria sp. CA-103260]
MPRETLTREQIVEAAVALLDAEGIDGLSMRRLGERLGNAATAVYWHVKSKDNLITLAGDAVWAEVDLPDLDAVDWRSAATAMAKDLFTMIVRHPWLVPAMSTHLIYGPGKARHDDHCLALFEAAGFSGSDADHAATVVCTFVLGTALAATSEIAWQTRLRRAGGDERDVVERVTEIARQFPRLRARSETWTGPDTTPEHELEAGVRTILDGLAARLPAGS